MLQGIADRSRAAAVSWIAAALAFGAAQAQPAPDLVLTNGRIVTVDDRFSLSEAVAVRGRQILAVGDAERIAALAGSATRTIDLDGRTVIPGLIDNHLHLLRAGTTWRDELRLDGVTSRARALEMLAERARGAEPGEWIYTLGGFTVDQFADDASALTRAELDRAAPDNPVYLQASYFRGYVNTRALEAFGLRAGAEPWVVVDAEGRPTGEIETPGIRTLTARLPEPSRETIETGTRNLIADLNRAGLTSAGSVGCRDELLDMYRARARREALDLRVFCIDGPAARTAAQVDALLPRISRIRLFQGDDYVDRIAYGEGVYGPLHDPMFARVANRSSESLNAWRRIVAEIARAGLPLHVHANQHDTISAFLDEIERVHADHPVRNLRWAFAHANELDAEHLERMKDLGIYAAVHPWAVINGGINRRVFGEAALGMPSLRTIEDSGITWGFGSDGSRANQVRPFATLAFAVTGRMVGGDRVLRESETLTREEALIAHTRRNAYLIFREDELGSIEPGKLADLVVLDRDYLSVPVAEIAETRALMTIVGGRIVHEGPL